MLRLLALLAVLVCGVHGQGSCVYNDGTDTYDISILQKSEVNPATLFNNWDVQEWDGTTSRAGTGRSNFTYFFNLCSPLVSRTNNQENVPVSNDDAAVVQVQTETYGNPKTVGVYSGAGLTSLFDGDLRYTFGPGDQCHHFSTARKAQIVFFCADVGLGTPVNLGENDYCEYIFLWNTCAACPMSSPIRQNCPGIYQSCTASNGLTAGSILLIVFSVCVFLYVVVGVVYQRYVVGARGREQFPNFSFWATCCGDVAEGCSITLCFWRKPKPLSVQYKGMDEDEAGADDI